MTSHCLIAVRMASQWLINTSKNWLGSFVQRQTSAHAVESFCHPALSAVPLKLPQICSCGSVDFPKQKGCSMGAAVGELTQPEEPSALMI